MAAAPPDRDVRRRIEAEFARSLLVEAGAGSGKTECLARRMAAGIAAGVYTVDGLAAVTFTRKAAAELRGRVQRALEDRLAPGDPPPSPSERDHVLHALANLERLFAGTIHAFCAALLRERPVEAGRAPDFTELDEVADARLRKQAWRDYWAHQRARGSEAVADLQRAGLREADLDGAFARMCDHADVAFPATRTACPGLDGARQATERFLSDMEHLIGPGGIPPGTKCKVQIRFDDLRRKWRSLRGTRPARIVDVLGTWDRADGSLKPTAKWWQGDPARAQALARAYRDEVVRPVLAAWREYVYGLAVTVLAGARGHYEDQRRRLNVVNYVDLLGDTARLLRDHASVRADLQRKFRWLLVDEFQDTDPIQAEILLWLASEAGAAGRDPWALPIRPGALFIVGDPKQSIYRFRRADIEVYSRLCQVFLDAPGRAEVLALTANFRSSPAICDFVNAFGATAFPRRPDARSPGYEPLLPADSDRRPRAEHGVRVLTVPRGLRAEEAARDEAGRIARVIARMVADGRNYGDFLVLTQVKASLPTFAEVFDRYDIPVEVSGAGRFAASPEVGALALLLRALADPSDQAALVGVLRGPLFGASDPDLYRYRTSGATLDLGVPLDEERDASLAADCDARHGPVRAAMRLLRDLGALARRLPLPVALDLITEQTGWLALAAATDGGGGAGRLLQAIDCARLVLADGGGLADAADVLEGEQDAGDVEAWPLEPGRGQVVRLMNLHKAKGLEAPVVFLADASRGPSDRVDLRIRRVGDRAEGFVGIARANGGWGSTPVAAPAGWEQHQADELGFLLAERRRLMYVAATRAGELLVISRLAPEADARPDAWSMLLQHVGAAAELAVPEAPRPVARAAIGLTDADQQDARAARARASDVVVRPSWAAALVTTETTRIAWAAGVPAVEAGVAGEPRIDPPGAGQAVGGAVTVLGTRSDEAMSAIVPDTPSHRAERDAAWGVLIHGLLEHAMRGGAREITREELIRLGAWLTLEHPELRPHLDAAAAIAVAVTRAPFWREALEARERHVEVPFAIRLAEGERGPDGAPVERPTVLHGVIDLVHSSREGWQVRDYKAGALPPDVMAEKYRPQLAAYLEAWTRVAGEPA
jgi:ATP-dependent helicase/nuclease subunit A